MAEEVYEGAIGIDLGSHSSCSVPPLQRLTDSLPPKARHIPVWLIMKAQTSRSVSIHGLQTEQRAFANHVLLQSPMNKEASQHLPSFRSPMMSVSLANPPKTRLR